MRLRIPRASAVLPLPALDEDVGISFNLLILFHKLETQATSSQKMMIMSAGSYPTASQLNSSQISPAREVLPNARGANPRTASTSAAICAGVVPQQPPIRFTKPDSANSRSVTAISSGVSS